MTQLDHRHIVRPIRHSETSADTPKFQTAKGLIVDTLGLVQTIGENRNLLLVWVDSSKNSSNLFYRVIIRIVSQTDRVPFITDNRSSVSSVTF